MIQPGMNIENQDNPEEINLNYFYNILANAKESNKYIKSLNSLFNDYFLLISHLYNSFNELYHKHFFEKTKCNINTPIYKIEYTIKNILQIQLNFLESMVSNAEIVTLIQNNLSELQKIIEKLPSKINKFSFNGINIDGVDKVNNSLYNYLTNLETKIVEEHISKKYKKHILGANTNDSIDDLVSQIQYLENTLVNILKLKKSQYFDELKKYYNKTNTVFNDLYKATETYISFVKETNKKFSDDLFNFEKEVKLKEIKDDKIEGKFIISKNDFDIKKQDFNRYKYKIQILKSNKINLQESQNNEEKTLNEDKNKDENNNISIINESKKQYLYLFLDDHDIYEIISKFYSYNFFFLDTSQYNLDVAKGKLDSLELSNQLLAACLNEKDEKNLEEKYEEIIQSIDEKILNNANNMKSFFITLNNFRGKGKNKFPIKLFDAVIHIYSKTGDYLLKNTDKNLSDIMLILSQTYYKEINGEKIYIADVIQSQEIYKDMKFWENVIIFKIEEEIKLVKKISSNSNPANGIKEKNKEELIKTKLFPFISIMKDFNISYDKISETIMGIIAKYKCSEDTKKSAISYLNSI